MRRGLYFRLFPAAVIRRALNTRAKAGEPILAYHHAYDIDTRQPFAYPDFGRWSAFAMLMALGRGTLMPRLEMAARLGWQFAAYGDHAAALARETE